MSSEPANIKAQRRFTINDITALKGGTPVVCLTAYTARMAELLDDTCDILLVGDSLGMVLYGMDSTLGVDVKTMIRHGQAVMRGSRKALVVIDMPFRSYEESPALAFRNAGRIMAQTGAQAIKLEGGTSMANTIRFLVDRGVPVMAHVGLTPQSVNTLGGFKAQGRDESDWEALIEDARAVAEAGAFATVIEGVTEPLAQKITGAVPNLTIGIGASRTCDGQILVTEDMLGFFEKTPKFVRRYAEVGETISVAVEEYARDVRARNFPDAAQTYAMPAKKA